MSFNEITSGGAVCLETLDGEPMANFINGSCLKRFHEPLTPKMLEKMHARLRAAKAKACAEHEI